MYCIKCGVKLADTEKKCPLCETIVYHPQLTQPKAQPLYPAGKGAEEKKGKKRVQGVIILLFMIPLLITFFSDWQMDGALSWFGYVAGALILTYLLFFLPFWFKKPRAEVIILCNFTAVAGYLFYINEATGGSWFFTFALPLVAVLCLLLGTVAAVLRRIKKGRLYVWGGALMALGAVILLIELLLCFTFGLPFIGWSVYPLVALALLGGALIYLAVDDSARETVERKLFF